MPEGYTHHPELEPQDYHPFDPEEALEELKAELAQMTKEERTERRPELFAILRQEIATQRDEIAKISNELEEYKATHPEADTETLLKIVNEIAPEARLSQRQINVFKQRIDNMIMADKEAELTIHQFQETFHDEWPKMLFAEHFGFIPKNISRVNTGSGGLIFELADPSDWRRLMEWRKKETGFAPSRSDGFISDIKHGQHYLVGVRRKWGQLAESLADPLPGAMLAHELKHSEDFALEPIEAGLPEIKRIINASKLDKDSEPEDVSRLIDKVMPLMHDRLLRTVRSEILAYFRTFDYIFSNSSKAKEVLFTIISSLIEMKSFGKSHMGKAIRSGMRAEERSERNIHFLEGTKASIASPISGQAYNYEEIASSMLTHLIEQKTKTDWSGLIEDKVRAEASEVKPLILSAIDSAIVIMQESDLQGREVDWLLQNRPMQYWPAMAKDLERAA